MLILAVVLLAAGVLATGVVTACLANLWTSDAAGNGLAQVYTLAFMAALWVLLAAAEVAAVLAGWLPVWGWACLLGLVPASAAGAVGGFALLVRRTRPRWPTIPLAVAPAALIAAGVQAACSTPGAVLGGEVLLAAMLGTAAAAALAPWPAAMLGRRAVRSRASGG